MEVGIGSVMSDQASTQKAFNHLVKEQAEVEQQHSGALDQRNIGPLLETLCGMHLGVNLRTAEVCMHVYNTEGKVIASFPGFTVYRTIRSSHATNVN